MGRASFARGRLSSRYVNAFVNSVDEGNETPVEPITLSQPPGSGSMMMMNMPPMQSPTPSSSTPVGLFMPNSPRGITSSGVSAPAVFNPSAVVKATNLDEVMEGDEEEEEVQKEEEEEYDANVEEVQKEEEEEKDANVEEVQKVEEEIDATGKEDDVQAEDKII